MTETWEIGRLETRSRYGMVACQNWMAAQAGADVLTRGGNAIDAAVTTALVLGVVEPWLSGIGGGGFLLRADGTTGAVDALDFNVVASRNLDPADYPLVDGRDGDWFTWPKVKDDRNLYGCSSICVPGAVAGLAEALTRYGTISWADALAPAIAHARRGLQLEWFAALALAIDGHNLARFPATSALFLRDGRPPRVPENGGEAFLPMPRLAETLERLAVAGPRDFYEGAIAASLVAGLAAGGSGLDAHDFKAYAPRWVTPQIEPYKGLEVAAIPGLSGGPTLCAALAELEHTLPAAAPYGKATALAFARAIQHANENRLTRLGHAGGQSCTAHLSVVDGSGTMVSLTNTLLSRFGSKVVLADTGFALNNGVMWFDPRPGRANSIAAGAQPLANMCPIIARRDGAAVLALGAAGGRQIVPAVMQILSYLAGFGVSLEEAFTAPRLDGSGPTIRVNSRAPADIAPALAAEFPVQIVEDTLYPVNFAIPSGVMRQGGENIGMVHPNHPRAAVRNAVA